MTRTLPTAALLAALLLPAAPAPSASPASPAVASHEIEVSLDPATGTIEGRDRMTVRRGDGGDLLLDLRADLEVRLLEVDGRVQESVAREEASPHPGIARYRVPVPQGPGKTAAVRMAWGGVVREEVRRAEDLAFVVGDRSRGTISPEGTFLTDATGWVPLDGSMATHAVKATVPEGWTVATQGGVPAASTAEGRTTFDFPAGIPCDGLWLQAGKWVVERRTTRGGTSIATYLSEGNAGHAKLILDSVEEYLGLYGKVLGPYPHAKFDVVENFFTTGYGMPSATLLGGDVIGHMAMMAARSGGKIPPGYVDHELVHCWWGNGVFVDYDSGNWCEALTSYCSNYLRKEWESAEEGAKHRRGTLARFAARVSPGKDYPLRKFTGKTEDFENDIGYGKGSMVFHQVRRAVGDDAFFGALRSVVRDFTGKRASWDDLRRAFEASSGRNLEGFFRQHLDRRGAPVLWLEGVEAVPSPDSWLVKGTVVQEGDPWSLTVPVVLETTAGRETALLDVVGEKTTFVLRAAALPTRVLLDPEAQCWRGFRAGEAPAMLDATLHDPEGFECWAPAGDAAAPFAPVLDAVAGRGAAVVRIAGPSIEPKPAPAGTRSVLALGGLRGDPGLRALLDEVRPAIRVEGTTLRVGDRRFEGEDLALLASVRHPAGPGRFLTVYAGMTPAALSGARRVLFYGGDGLVVFKGGRPVLRLEPEGGGSTRAPVLVERTLRGADPHRAKALVDALCAEGVEGRLAGSPADAAARGILAAAMEEAELEPRTQEFSFTYVRWDGTPSCEGPEPGSRPMTFSGPAPDPVPVDPRGQVMLTGPDVKAEDLLAAVRAAVEKGATSILVVGPPEVPRGIADYVFPLPPVRGTTGEPVVASDSGLAQAGAQARAPLAMERLSIPAVYYPKPPQRSALPGTVRAAVETRTVASANLLAVLPGTDPALAGEAVLLGAHHDHLGPGFPGANDDASGVAAVLEAARILSAHRRLLRRPVVVAFFGAEEWGLRGSRAFAGPGLPFTPALPEGTPRPVAVLNLDTVGQWGVDQVHVVGESVYPRLAAVMGRCLEGAGLERGSDIDRFAFAHGSDHYAFHEAGIPSIDLFSTEYRLLHTVGDDPTTVDGGKVARLARAAAAFVLAVSREGIER